MISDKICDRLITAGVIPEAQKALYRYGVSQLLLTALNVITTALIGVLMGMIWQSLLFLAAYIPLRRFAGGIHASTPARCYFCSVGLIICVLFLLSKVPESALPIGAAAVSAAAALWFLTPVEDPNKPFSEAEEVHFRRQSRRILLAETIIALVLLACGFFEAACCFVFALWVLVFMDALGEAKNRRLKKNGRKHKTEYRW